jgi:predicted 2-oxoglutarate/Fe(II)-dependent dioxygenase YbiX/peroxiredoxin
MLGPGEAAPWFECAALGGPANYVFDTAGGRPVLMLFFGSARNAAAAAALAAVAARAALFDDVRASFFGVTIDPADAKQGRIRRQTPGIRFLLDYDRAVSRAFGAALDEASGQYQPHWLLLDPMMRVTGQFALAQGAAALEAFERLVAAPPAPDWAPVAMAANVFEPALCRTLIERYEADGGEQSGFMRDIDGKTRLVFDPAHKVRRDYLIEEPELARQLNLRLIHRLLPVVKRVFMFTATRVERLVVGCYEAESGGHFRAHRDNTGLGTAHRRFAVTINLNAEEYEGGDLCFPEFGPRTYRAPTGGAVVFSCELLHRAMPVTKGRRFALLPFLYDEAGAKLREENARFMEGELADYRADRDVVVR